MTDFSFTCTKCREIHTGIPDLMAPHPAEYAAIPERERLKRTDLSSDTCVIDEKWFFVLALLDIPIHERDESLTYGLWVSLSPQSILTYSSLYEAPGRETHAPVFAWLTTPPPLFGKGPLKSRLHFSPLPNRPKLELEPTDHPLAVAQREGISQDRLREILADALHGD